MKTQPGYISTKLYQVLLEQSFLGKATYKLIHVAVREGQAAFNATAQKIRAELEALVWKA